MCITPLGSNNYTYQNLNNLFLTAPVTIYAFVKWFRRRYPSEKVVLLFPTKAMLSALAVMILIQSVGFHFHFVFRDGMDGSPRNTVMKESLSVTGMRTTQKNADALGGLLSYMEAQEREERGIIYFGNCPGLAYLLKKPAVIESTWPDLDSNPVSWFEAELKNLKERPLIIIRNTDPTSDSYVEKKELLQDYMSVKHYQTAYENDGYTVYEPQEK